MPWSKSLGLEPLQLSSACTRIHRADMLPEDLLPNYPVRLLYKRQKRNSSSKAEWMDGANLVLKFYEHLHYQAGLPYSQVIPGNICSESP